MKRSSPSSRSTSGRVRSCIPGKSWSCQRTKMQRIKMCLARFMVSGDDKSLIGVCDCGFTGVEGCSFIGVFGCGFIVSSCLNAATAAVSAAAAAPVASAMPSSISRHA